MARIGKTEIVDELHSLGYFGLQAIGLLLKLTEEELRRFPALTSDGVNDAEDYAQSFFLACGLPLTTAVSLEAADDEVLGRMFRRWLRNWLVDQNTETAMGALRDRLEKRLDRDPRFQRSPVQHFWFLSGELAEAGTDDVTTLSTVARRVHVTYYPEPPGGKRRAQLGKTGELENLLKELLVSARGSLHISTLVAVVANRFPHVLDPHTIYPDEGENTSIESVADPNPSPLTELMQEDDDENFGLLAEVAFRQLTQEEKELVLVLDDLKEAMKLLGLQRSSASLRISRFRSRLIEIAGNDSNSREILRRIIGLCNLSYHPETGVAMDNTGFVPSTQGGGLNL